MKIIAIVVTYNPDLELLKKSLFTYIDAVDNVYIIDNSTELFDATKFTNISNKIKFEKLGENKGIAYALNYGINLCAGEKPDYILTMDQDTLYVPSIRSFPLDAFNQNIMAIVPVLDQRIKNIQPYNVKNAIQSGAIFKYDILKLIGEFNNNYFIDYVDYEYFKRGRNLGYKILCLPSMSICHQNGDLFEGKLLFWKYKYNFSSPMRMYYQTRNAIDYIIKYKDYKQLLVFIKLIFKTFLISDRKSERFKFIIKGIIDWRANNWGKYHE